MKPGTIVFSDDEQGRRLASGVKNLAINPYQFIFVPDIKEWLKTDLPQKKNQLLIYFNLYIFSKPL